MMYGPYLALVRDWHDGDTCHPDIDLGFGVILAAYDTKGKPIRSLRILGIDAPELDTPLGPSAKTAAEALAPPGSQVSITSGKWDKYGGRIDGSMILPNGKDFAEEMLALGLARPYTGVGPKPWTGKETEPDVSK